MELIHYQKWVTFGRMEKHYPPDSYDHSFHHYFAIIHAMFSEWEASKYENPEEGDTITDSKGNKHKVGDAEPKGLASSPRTDSRMKDSRPGRTFPTLKNPLR